MTAKRLVARAASAAAVLAIALVARAARAEEPCAGCRLSLPDGDAQVPLVVALHGDYQAAATMHDAWKKLALARGFALLSLACPTSLGCKGSWWRWDGNPAWVKEQVDKVDAKRAVDRDRLWLVGWSGGASYIGAHAQAFARQFAATAIHGGGMAPSDDACEDPKTPVYFLVGDKNPLHALAIRLRDHYARCGADVTWDLVRGADHPGEWAAIATHGRAVLDFFAAHPRRPPP